MTVTMNVSLPEPLKAFVDEQVRLGAYGSTSDYVRQLIRDDREKAAARMLQTLIAEGLQSGAPTAIEADYWRSKRRQHGL